MTNRDYVIARTLKERLAEFLDLVEMRVFGSKARGDEDEFSDMDVFIEVDALDRQLKKRIGDAVWEVGFSNFLMISPLVFTRADIEASPLKSSPIVRNVLREGIVI